MAVVALIIAVPACDLPHRLPRRSTAWGVHGGCRQSACVVRFRPEHICAVTDSVSEQQRSLRSTSRLNA